MLGIVFIYNVIRGEIGSTDLVSLLNFPEPCRLARNYIPLILNHCIFNYDLHEPFRVLCSDYNILYLIMSISDSPILLKQLILRFLAQN